MRRLRISLLIGVVLFIAFAVTCCAAEATSQPTTIRSEQFTADVTRFLQTELAAHVEAVKMLDPPQPTVLGVGTGGDFTWGSFMRAITEVTALTGGQTVGGRDAPGFLGKLGL